MPFLGARGLRRVQVLVFCLGVFLCLGSRQNAHATPAQELEQARESFLNSDFKAAVGQFSALLYPTSRLADATTIAEVHLLLGVCYFETDQQQSAKREFEEALLLNSQLRLEAGLFSAEAIAFFEEKRTKLEEKAKAAAESAKLSRKQQALNKAIQNSVVIEKRRYYVNLLPFGLGQFQNGQTNKGIAFFAAQTLTGGASAGIWTYQVVKYGLGGKVPREEVSTVNTLQRFQIGSGILFFGLFAWGVVDSLANYEHAVTREVDPSLIKILEDIYDKPTTSMQLVPLITEDAGGVSAFWEF